MVWARISLEYRTDLHIFKPSSVMAVRYRDEVLEPIVRLYAAAVGPTFVLMDDNARPHRADIVDDYLESEGIALTLIELETALQEEWRLLNSAVVDHLIEGMSPDAGWDQMGIVDPDDPDKSNETKLLNYCIVIGPGQVCKISNSSDLLKWEKIAKAYQLNELRGTEPMRDLCGAVLTSPALQVIKENSIGKKAGKAINKNKLSNRQDC
ncbi:transposable element Tcb1 transposase [Trichonephila clavipes]|nr:transposable element Tcb1 transposase [Trichonephila clavipes]